MVLLSANFEVLHDDDIKQVIQIYKPKDIGTKMY